MYSIPATYWLSLFFITFYSTWGIFLPFWGAWLSSNGISSENIGLLFTLGLVLRFVSSLSLLSKVSSAKSILRLLRILIFCNLIAFSCLLFTQGELWMAVLTLVINFAIGPLMPLGDIVGIRLVNQIGIDYGRVRLLGSVSFIIGSTVVGWLIVANGEQAILWSIVFLVLIMWLLSLLNLTPKLQEQPKAVNEPKTSLWSLFKKRDVLIFLVIIGAIQGSHGAFYAFGTIYWSEVGLSGASIAGLWAIGVAAEVILMRFNIKLFKSWSIKQMLLLGVIAAILRWLVFAGTDNFYILAFIQTFHAFTFAVTHLAAIRYISFQKDNEIVLYQSLYSGVALGLMMAIFTYVAGFFYEDLKGGVFLIMSLSLLPILGFIKIWKVE
ncbi:MAG: 3-phenylpropionate MFS transporter [Psychromonas sp.]